MAETSIAENKEKEERPVMDDETQAIADEKRKKGKLLLLEKEKERAISKKKGGWFQKIPTDILASPGGIVIIFIALLIEILGALVPIPILNTIMILPLQIIFYILLITVAKVSIKSLILPSVAELFFPFLPIWMIKILSSFF